MLRGLLVLAVALLARPVWADPNHCDICGGPLGERVYTPQDGVTGERKQVCLECAMLGTVCFFCGLPVRTNYTQLPDGRFICAREAQTAVIEESDARRACSETKEGLDRLFSRFLDFPETNVTISVVDRVHLQELFKFPGKDYVCPNVWGYTATETNRQHLEHYISLLSGLPRAAFKATCAHEYTHVWLNENVSGRRKRILSKDATEGFCELIAYLLMNAENEDAQKRLILLNAYTRGQINIFIETERAYGMNDIADWMKYGIDDRLRREDLLQVRNVELPRPGAHSAGILRSAAAPAAPDTLALRGIILAPNHPQALINNSSFRINQTGQVRVGTTNLTIRCLSITRDCVRIKILTSGEERDLKLPDDSK